MVLYHTTVPVTFLCQRHYNLTYIPKFKANVFKENHWVTVINGKFIGFHSI